MLSVPPFRKTFASLYYDIFGILRNFSFVDPWEDFLGKDWIW
jgi:hypothetical protein